MNVAPVAPAAVHLMMSVVVPVDASTAVGVVFFTRLAPEHSRPTVGAVGVPGTENDALDLSMAGPLDGAKSLAVASTCQPLEVRLPVTTVAPREMSTVAPAP